MSSVRPRSDRTTGLFGEALRQMDGLIGTEGFARCPFNTDETRCPSMRTRSVFPFSMMSVASLRCGQEEDCYEVNTV